MVIVIVRLLPWRKSSAADGAWEGTRSIHRLDFGEFLGEAFDVAVGDKGRDRRQARRDQRADDGEELILVPFVSGLALLGEQQSHTGNRIDGNVLLGALGDDRSAARLAGSRHG